MREPLVFSTLTTAVVVAFSTGLVAETATYAVDTAKSQATLHVGKAGAFGFIAGHSHEVTGPIEAGSIDVDLDEPSRSRLRLVIATSELKVSPAGEPEGDAPKVQAAMQRDKVLDVPRYPKITYESGVVAVKSRRGPVMELSVTGRLTIRDVTQDVTVPVHVEITATTLSAKGQFEISQRAFGIKPISVGGVVSVKNIVGVDFFIVASK